MSIDCGFASSEKGRKNGKERLTTIGRQRRRGERERERKKRRRERERIPKQRKTAWVIKIKD